MKPNVIVMSHGCLAKEAVASAKMIVGDMLQVAVVCMEAQDGLSGTQQKLEQLLHAYEDKPVLIITDLYGGTPFNTAVMAAKHRADTMVIAGLNLNMLIEYSVAQIEDLNQLATYLCDIGRQGILMPETDDEDDDIELD